MRRDQFLKSITGLAMAGALPREAGAAPVLKMMIPANPGGGWDTTGRALGRALTEGRLADAVQYENKGGAAGVLGLAQFVGSAKQDPHSIIMMGAVISKFKLGLYLVLLTLRHAGPRAGIQPRKSLRDKASRRRRQGAAGYRIESCMVGGRAFPLRVGGWADVCGASRERAQGPVPIPAAGSRPASSRGR